MRRTFEHYGRLGFTVAKNDEGFAILKRDDIELHFALKPDHDPARTATWVYIRVEDVDTLYEELKSAGVQDLREPHNTDYNAGNTAHRSGRQSYLVCLAHGGCERREFVERSVILHLEGCEMNATTETHCPRCNVPMTCSLAEDCWCAKLPRGPVPINNDAHCLCPDCLVKDLQSSSAT
jgi:hypothetical protein